eukprot:TRINITY_DN17164_c0_g1_i1.p1 TRINITY_DN17164_c0_g1~~TRINITY_DN17164_c0_g1_i1.p1  ORF type:complete len:390 (+),score=48.71 TRINITY_DN17164_c0_g1_i1:3-1172(+)
MTKFHFEGLHICCFLVAWCVAESWNGTNGTDPGIGVNATYNTTSPLPAPGVLNGTDLNCTLWNCTDNSTSPLPEPPSIPAYSYHECDTEGLLCGCTTLWDSDCYCDDRPRNQTLCNCTLLLSECWQDRPLSAYNLTASACPFPLLDTISVTLYTTALDPQGMALVSSWQEVLEVVGSAVAFQLVFDVSVDGSDRLVSAHGEEELELEMMIECAVAQSPRVRAYYPFLSCLNKYMQQKPLTYIEECALGHGFNYSKLMECSRETGEERLRQHLNDKAHLVPAVYFEHQLQNYDKQTAKDYIVSLCSEFNNPSSDSRTFPWWVFTLMACVAMALVIVIWISKSDSSWGLSSLFCGVFYEVDDSPSGTSAADEVLRLWQVGGLREDEEETSE